MASVKVPGTWAEASVPLPMVSADGGLPCTGGYGRCGAVVHGTSCQSALGYEVVKHPFFGRGTCAIPARQFFCCSANGCCMVAGAVTGAAEPPGTCARTEAQNASVSAGSANKNSDVRPTQLSLRISKSPLPPPAATLPERSLAINNKLDSRRQGRRPRHYRFFERETARGCAASSRSTCAKRWSKADTACSITAPRGPFVNRPQF